MSALAPGSTIDGYRIERVIGIGQMGDIYLAKCPDLPRHDALKVISRELLEKQSFRQRFINEGDVAARLSHPNVVAVYRRGKAADGLLWIAMQYVKGTNADAVLREGKMTAARAVDITAGIAEAIDHAHSRHVIHRDIKPANFLLTDGGVDAEEQVLLADFGIAHLLGQAQLATAGAVLGTIAYAAPEVLTGKVVDGKADIYALGCSLFRMLTGTSPYPDEGDVKAVIKRHLYDPPPRVTDHVRRLSPAMDGVIATAMAKEPSQRFGSARELADAARAALNESPVRRSGSAKQPPPRTAPPPRPKPTQASAESSSQERPAAEGVPPIVQAAPLTVEAAPSMWSSPVRSEQDPAADMIGGSGESGQSRPRQDRYVSFNLQDAVATAGERGRLIRVGGAAAAIVVVVAMVIWWMSGVGEESGGRVEPAASSAAAGVSRDAAAETRLAGLIPPSYPAGDCTGLAPNNGRAQAEMACRAVVVPAADAVPATTATVTYQLLRSRVDMQAALKEMSAGGAVVPCPGNIQSPGPWRRNASPDRIAGTLVCSMNSSQPVVSWTVDSDLLTASTSALSGQVSLDQLYSWWTMHS